jgi:uncharacterized protein YrrD
MLKLYSQLVELPIMSLREGHQVGHISDLIIDPLNGRLLAYTTKGSWLRPSRIIAAADIREVSSDLAIVDSGEVLTDSEEIVRVGQVLSSKIRLIRSRVQTENGTKLGRVTDYAVNVLGHVLERLNVQSSPLGRELLIPHEDIVEIKKGLIIVKEQLVPAREEVKRAVGVPGAT